MDELPGLRWSDTFAVLAPSSTSSKNLRGDKIILPQSALEQLLSISAAQSLSSRGSSQGYRYGSDHVSNGLPPHRAQGELPNPLMFRLSNTINDKFIFAGIREFSAPDGAVGLSSFLCQALGIHETADTKQIGTDAQDPVDADVELTSSSLRVTVESRQLPKGSYVRLRPLEAGYNPDDWKSLLERQLRDSFTTLTRGSVLSVQGVQGETFQFLIDELAPHGDGVCCVDTDMEVDIEALSEEQARETMRQIMSKSQTSTSGGSSQGGELDVWKSVQGQVVPGDYVDYVLPSWNRSQRLDVTLSDIDGEEGSLDLFVTPRTSRQRALPRQNVHVFGNFDSAPDATTKTISIAPSNVELDEAESILVSVHANTYIKRTDETPAPIRFTLRARVASHDDVETNVSAEHSPDDEQCQNCLQWIPKRTMVLHESFCRRNNVICPECKSVFRKGSPEWESHWHCQLDSAHGNQTSSKAKHDDVFHGNHQCPSCDFSTNSLPDMARHRTSVCPGKLILCRFCHLEVPQEGDPLNPSPEVVLSGMTAHELADGARTTECHLCDKIIRLRDMELHLKHHELDKVHRAKPDICRNRNCGRTLLGVSSKRQTAGVAATKGPGNDLGLCSLCFGPLYVSMHDPEGKALRRRIERRYLSQLMTGCGKSHCGNEWCKTGRAHLDLEAKGTSAQTALPLIKPLLSSIADTSEPMFFCVDESNQTRRKLAEMMASEKVWDLEWCIAAAEAEKGNVDKMRDWLQAWAPKI